jgi:hypothetical protein
LALAPGAVEQAEIAVVEQIQKIRQRVVAPGLAAFAHHLGEVNGQRAVGAEHAQAQDVIINQISKR